MSETRSQRYARKYLEEIGLDLALKPAAFGHTATPWDVSVHLGITNPLYVGVIANLGLNAEDNMIAVVTTSGHVVTMAEANANARRIVAAVNATADIPIAVLEGMGARAQQRYEARMSEASGA